MPKILLVEDDLELADSLRLWLPTQGHQVEHVASGKDAMQLLTSFSYDIILLDWNLPDATGLEICKQFRGAGGTTQIIFVTAESDIENKQQGLDFGGDDYIVKPFDPRELAARIRSLLRRPVHLVPNDLSVNGVALDPQTRVMTIDGNKISLRPKEAALLEYLMRHVNRVYSAQALLDAVWPSDATATHDTIRTWIKQLRTKLAAAGKGELIKTVLGSGYVIEDPTQPAP